MNENVICIVASHPDFAEINSELERLLGKTQAAFLSRSILMDTISASLCVPESSVCIAFWPPDCREHFEDLLALFENEEEDIEIAALAESVGLLPQSGRNFGERFANVSNRLFSEGAERAVFVSPGNPLLQPVILQASIEMLRSNRAIVGPTFDGGFYLIGSDAYYPALFNSMDWNDSCLYKSTVERLNEIGLAWQELEITYQINSPEELEQLYIDIDNLRLTGENRIAFHTEKCLANLSR